MIKQKIKFLQENIQRFNRNIKKHAGGRFIYCWFTLIWCALRFGSSFDDYFRYEFYKKNDFERNKFITYYRSRKLISNYNDSNYTKYFHDKGLFYSYFNKYIKRDWIDLRDCNKNDFEKFIAKHKNFIVKPATGSKGEGIVEYSYNATNSIESVLKKYPNHVAEEKIAQHDLMKSFNPSSVNTIRIMTFLKGEDVIILGCNFRCGSDISFTDSFSAGGMVGSIDITSGLVFVPCINKEYERFLYHPSSNAQLIGFKIPHWDAVVSKIESAAKLIPQVRYLGWDMAIVKDGVEIIEANHDPAHRTIQMADLVGKYDILKNYMD